MRAKTERESWWLHARSRPEMRAMGNLNRYIATPMVTSTASGLGRRRSSRQKLIAFARDDDTTFGILHSRFHELWSLRMGTWLGVGNDPRYTPSTTFETFPFPEGLTPDLSANTYAGTTRGRGHRRRGGGARPAAAGVAEPARPRAPRARGGAGLPRPRPAGRRQGRGVLKKRTLTNLYNARPAWLDHAHAGLDAAVAEAYGWGEDWRAGRLDDDAILARLFALNQARAGRPANRLNPCARARAHAYVRLHALCIFCASKKSPLSSLNIPQNPGCTDCRSVRPARAPIAPPPAMCRSRP